MKRDVIFTLPGHVVQEATKVVVLGDFNNWTPRPDCELKKQSDGSFSATVPLDEGKTYQYRFLIDDEKWINDHKAEGYAPVAEFFVENSVITVPVAEESSTPKKVGEETSKPANKTSKIKPAETTAKIAPSETTKPTKAPAKSKAPKKDASIGTVADSKPGKAASKKAGQPSKAANKGGKGKKNDGENG